jgi:S1-C subfamily serine protease
MPSSTNLKDWIWPIVAGAAVGFILLSSSIFQSHPNSGSTQPVASYSTAVSKAAPAVVSIYTRRLSSESGELLNDAAYRLYRNLGMVRNEDLQSTVLGSGVIISPDGFIATNRHVIEGATNILVILADGREASASIYADDEVSDLALLKINLPNLAHLELSNEQTTNVGDVVLAIGNPVGVGLTVTQGIVSATQRVGGDIANGLYLQTDAAINPGNSGGALVNSRGDLIGISTSILGRQTEGISFAIPTPTVKFVVDSLITNGRVIRGWLGIAGGSINAAYAREFNVPTEHGLAVVGIAPNSPAEAAGLETGDVIIGWNGKPISSGAEIMQNVATAAPGETLTLSVWRQNREITLALEVIERP